MGVSGGSAVECRGVMAEIRAVCGGCRGGRGGGDEGVCVVVSESGSA